MTWGRSDVLRFVWDGLDFKELKWKNRGSSQRSLKMFAGPQIISDSIFRGIKWKIEVHLRRTSKRPRALRSSQTRYLKNLNEKSDEVHLRRISKRLRALISSQTSEVNSEKPVLYSQKGKHNEFFTQKGPTMDGTKGKNCAFLIFFHIRLLLNHVKAM